MARYLPVADVYEARYDIKGAQKEGRIELDSPTRIAKIIALSFETALKTAKGLQKSQELRGTLVHELELRDLRLVDTGYIVAVPAERPSLPPGFNYTEEGSHEQQALEEDSPAPAGAPPRVDEGSPQLAS